MKTFQKLAAVLSISLLAAIGAQSVQAAEQVNGISINGISINGSKVNGTSLDGRLLKAGQVFAVTLPVSVA